MLNHVHTAPRLLIIDDDPLLRGMAAHTLRHAGFDVTEAEDGVQGLALLEKASFDLLLLDVMMPHIDGYEVCRRVRQMPHSEHVPILMLTGLNDTASIELTYEAGATDFISKPINWTLLSHRVRYCLRAGVAIESATRSRDRLERAQYIANMGGWELTEDGQRFICSPELVRVLAAPAHVVSRARPDDFLALICDEDREKVRALRLAAQMQGKSYQLTFGIQRFDGAVRTVFEQAAAVIDRNGRQVAVEGITQDITDRVEAQEQIKQLAHYDSLTGLPNRQFFSELAGPALDRSERLGAGCAMVYVDMDRFKSVNDAVGYAQGDTVLRLISARLKASIRTSDIASEVRKPGESMVSRVGANAFTLLLVDIEDDKQATVVADRLLSSIAAPIMIDEHELVLTASIGIALYPRDASDTEGLTRCAEQAAYAAKSAGRAQYRFFDEAMNVRASARLARESDLRRAISEGQLRLHYQPKVDASNGLIMGAEALVRWQHPERGMVSPGEFIPLAEESGLILPLTDWVLETACADLRRRADMGLRLVPVSVNLSSPSFADDGLRHQLEGLMARYGLDTNCLVLEVTESLLMADVERAIARLQELREMGFRVSLDDFGTGYSSLSYLKRFPIDELKIDRSFVTDVCHGGRDGAIAVSIIALGRVFGLEVVAEGVETWGQSTFLLAHGCSCQQGYLFAKPMPADAFNAMLVSSSAPFEAAALAPQVPSPSPRPEQLKALVGTAGNTTLEG
jgi:diguanylate cyclase (GGDEF)-like protein